METRSKYFFFSKTVLHSLCSCEGSDKETRVTAAPPCQGEPGGEYSGSMSGGPESQESAGDMEGEGEEIIGRSGGSEKEDENPPIEEEGEGEGEGGESEEKENESVEESSGSSEKQEDSSIDEGKDYEEEEISVFSMFYYNYNLINFPRFKWMHLGED